MSATKQAVFNHTTKFRHREAHPCRFEITSHVNVTYNVPMDIEMVIHGFSYAGIFALMIANGFVSFPSSQLLYIIVGYFIGTGALLLLPASLLGALGNTIGNILLYEAVRQHGVRYLKKIPDLSPRGYP